MKKGIVFVLFVCVVLSGIAFFTTDVAAKNDKFEAVVGVQILDADNPNEVGTTWLSDGNIMHHRDYVYLWHATSDDLELQGDNYVDFNANLKVGAEGTNGRMWGKFTFELTAGGSWEGSWQGVHVNGVQSGVVVGKGFGGIVEGKKLKLYFKQRPGLPIVDLEGTVLNPGGKH